MHRSAFMLTSKENHAVKINSTTQLCSSETLQLNSLGRDANDTASRTRSSIASLERLLVVTLAEVVSAGVNNNGALHNCQLQLSSINIIVDTYADNALGANELDKLIGQSALGVALAIGFKVAQVANMASLIGGSTVGLAMGVKVRTSRGATIGVVTKGVNVEATLGVGIVAGDVVGNGGGRVLRLLLEHDGSRDLGITTEDSDCTRKMRLANGYVSRRSL